MKTFQIILFIASLSISANAKIGSKTKADEQKQMRESTLGGGKRPSSDIARGLNVFKNTGNTIGDMLSSIFCFIMQILSLGLFSCDDSSSGGTAPTVIAPTPTAVAPTPTAAVVPTPTAVVPTPTAVVPTPTAVVPTPTVPAPTEPRTREAIYVTASRRIRQHVDVAPDYTQFTDCVNKGHCIPSKYIADHMVALPSDHDGRILQSITLRHTGTSTAYADERFVDQVFIYDICMYIHVAGQETSNISHNNEAWCLCGQKGAKQSSFPTYGHNNVISFPGDGLFVPAGAEIRYGLGGAFMREDGTSDDNLNRYYLGCQRDGYLGVPANHCHQLADLGNLEIDMEMYELPLDMTDWAVYQMMRVPYVDVFLLNRNSPSEGHNFNVASEIGAVFEYVTTTSNIERWNSVLYRERNGVVETLLDQQQQRSHSIGYRKASLSSGDVPLDLGSLREMPIAVGDTVGIYCNTLNYSNNIMPFNDCAYWVAARVYPTDSSHNGIFKSIDTIRPHDRESFCSAIGPRHTGSPMYTDAYNSKERCLELLSNEMAVDMW